MSRLIRTIKHLIITKRFKLRVSGYKNQLLKAQWSWKSTMAMKAFEKKARYSECKSPLITFNTHPLQQLQKTGAWFLYSLSLFHTHTHTHTLSFSLFLSLFSLSPSLYVFFTHTHTLSLFISTHTQLTTLSLSLSLSLSLTLTLTLSFLYLYFSLRFNCSD